MIRTIAVFLLSCGVSVKWIAAQQTPAPAVTLSSALAALNGTNVQSLSISGNVESIAGSTDDTGTFTVTCGTNGSSQLGLQLSGGSLSETRQITNGVPSGTWTDSQGVQHPMVLQNLLPPQPWFCPLIVLSEVVSATTLNIQFVGTAVKNGVNALHFTVNAPFGVSQSQPSLMTHLSQLDIYLDPTTSMPTVFDFNIHPDNNANLDIPVEIQFSNYAQSGGVWVPNMTEEFINSSLALTLQVQSATPSLSAQQ